MHQVRRQNSMHNKNWNFVDNYGKNKCLLVMLNVFTYLEEWNYSPSTTLLRDHIPTPITKEPELLCYQQPLQGNCVSPQWFPGFSHSEPQQTILFAHFSK